ncbi:hypothetical protein ACQ86D_26475 [Streptomyces galilaeus]
MDTPHTRLRAPKAAVRPPSPTPPQAASGTPAAPRNGTPGIIPAQTTPQAPTEPLSPPLETVGASCPVADVPAAVVAAISASLHEAPDTVLADLLADHQPRDLAAGLARFAAWMVSETDGGTAWLQRCGLTYAVDSGPV